MSRRPAMHFARWADGLKPSPDRLSTWCGAEVPADRTASHLDLVTCKRCRRSHRAGERRTA